MIRLNSINTPYSNLRPKTFFADRKKMLTHNIINGNGGKSYNPDWKIGKTTGDKEVKPEIKISYDDLTLYYMY